MTGDRSVILSEVRAYMAKRDNHFASERLQATGFFAPDDSKRRTVTEFAKIMDNHTARIMREFPDMDPVEWEAFLELLPNARKLLGMVPSEWGGK